MNVSESRSTFETKLEHSTFGQVWPQYLTNTGSGRKLGLVHGNQVIEVLIDHDCWITPPTVLDSWTKRLPNRKKFTPPLFPVPTVAHSVRIQKTEPAGYTHYNCCDYNYLSEDLKKRLRKAAEIQKFVMENEDKHWLAARPAIEQSRLESIARQLSYNSGAKTNFPFGLEPLDLAMRKNISKVLKTLANDKKVWTKEERISSLNPAKDLHYTALPEEPEILDEEEEEETTGQPLKPDDKKSDHFNEVLGRSWEALLESPKFMAMTDAKEAERYACGVAYRQSKNYWREIYSEKGEAAAVSGCESGEALDGGFDDAYEPNIALGGRYERPRSGKGTYGTIQSPLDPKLEGSMTPRIDDFGDLWNGLDIFQSLHAADYSWMIQYYEADSNSPADRQRAVRLRAKAKDIITAAVN